MTTQCRHLNIHTERLMVKKEEDGTVDYSQKVIVSYCADCGLELKVVPIKY